CRPMAPPARCLLVVVPRPGCRRRARPTIVERSFQETSEVAMLTLGSILALAAAALHVVIFRLESLAWGAGAEGVRRAESAGGRRDPRAGVQPGLLQPVPRRARGARRGARPRGDDDRGGDPAAGRDRVDARRRDRAAAELPGAPRRRREAGRAPAAGRARDGDRPAALTLPVRGAPGRPQRRIEARWSAMRSTASASTSACGRVTRRRWSGSG